VSPWGRAAREATACVARGCAEIARPVDWVFIRADKLMAAAYQVRWKWHVIKTDDIRECQVSNFECPALQ